MMEKFNAYRQKEIADVGMCRKLCDKGKSAEYISRKLKQPLEKVNKWIELLYPYKK